VKDVEWPFLVLRDDLLHSAANDQRSPKAAHCPAGDRVNFGAVHSVGIPPVWISERKHVHVAMLRQLLDRVDQHRYAPIV
jgi:hypothetical protein